MPASVAHLRRRCGGARAPGAGFRSSAVSNGTWTTSTVPGPTVVVVGACRATPSVTAVLAGVWERLVTELGNSEGVSR
jgi:hypothetical protein